MLSFPQAKKIRLPALVESNQLLWLNNQNAVRLKQRKDRSQKSEFRR